MQLHENIQQIILEDLNKQSLKRIISIRSNLEMGNILKGSELEFLSKMIAKIKICQQGAENDADCMTIFTSVSHLLSLVVSLAFDNENKNKSA